MSFWLAKLCPQIRVVKKLEAESIANKFICKQHDFFVPLPE